MSEEYFSKKKTSEIFKFVNFLLRVLPKTAEISHPEQGLKIMCRGGTEKDLWNVIVVKVGLTDGG